MSLKIATMGLLSLTLVAAAPDLSYAQKPKTDALYPVTADFRCPLGLDCSAPDRIDRLAGDSLGPVTGTTPAGSTTTTVGQASNHGAYLTATYAFQLILKQGYGRFVSLDFSEPTATAPCASKNACRKQFETIYTDHSMPPGMVVPVDDAGRDLSNGFYGIAIGQSARARYWFNFSDPLGRDLLWTVRFAPANYPGSSWLTVTRVGSNTWTIEATTADVATLESATTAGKTVKVHEGFYRLPFKITVTR